MNNTGISNTSKQFVINTRPNTSVSVNLTNIDNVNKKSKSEKTKLTNQRNSKTPNKNCERLVLKNLDKIDPIKVIDFIVYKH